MLDTKAEDGGSQGSDAAQLPDKPGSGLRRIASSDLFQGQSVITIEHAGSDYRLRITRQRKLILTK